MPVELKCEVCGADYSVPPSRAETAKTCSHSCAVSYRAKARQRRTQLNCKLCGAAFEAPNSHADRRIYCSTTCREASPEMRAMRAGNTRAANANWKGGRPRRSDGYIYALAGWHPFATHSGYVLEHRLVMERWLLQNDPASKFLIYVKGHLVLSPEYEVHHDDEDKANNDIANLQCLTSAEHRALHNQRNAKGK